MFFSSEILLRTSVMITMILCFSTQVSAQILNEEIAAKILVDDTGEFFNVRGMAENLSLADRTLQYEFSIFKKDSLGQMVKESDKGRFVIAAAKIEELGSVTVSTSEKERIIIILVVYDLDKKPLGQDRIVFNDNPEKNAVKATLERPKPKVNKVTSPDMTASKDGFVLEGLVIEESITKMGQDFYRLFYSKYYLSDLNLKKNVIIKEIPGRLRNTRIAVSVGDQVVWQFFANPSRDYLKRQVDIAFSKVLQQLQNLEQIKQEFIGY